MCEISPSFYLIVISTKGSLKLKGWPVLIYTKAIYEVLKQIIKLLPQRDNNSNSRRDEGKVVGLPCTKQCSTQPQAEMADL